MATVAAAYNIADTIVAEPKPPARRHQRSRAEVRREQATPDDMPQTGVAEREAGQRRRDRRALRAREKSHLTMRACATAESRVSVVLCCRRWSCTRRNWPRRFRRKLLLTLWPVGADAPTNQQPHRSSAAGFRNPRPTHQLDGPVDGNPHPRYFAATNRLYSLRICRSKY